MNAGSRNKKEGDAWVGAASLKLAFITSAQLTFEGFSAQYSFVVMPAAHARQLAVIALQQTSWSADGSFVGTFVSWTFVGCFVGNSVGDVFFVGALVMSSDFTLDPFLS